MTAPTTTVTRRSPSLAAAVTRAIRAAIAATCVAGPASVLSYDSTRGRVTVQPQLKRPYADEGGKRKVERLPVLNDVPLMFVGAGSRRIKYPVTKGDLVLLVHADRSLDLWRTRGAEVDPGDGRSHALTDAIAIIGLDPSAEDADVLIEFTPSGQVHAGGSAALALLSELVSLVSTFNSHTHTVPIIGAAGTTPSTPPLIAASAPTGTVVLKGA